MPTGLQLKLARTALHVKLAGLSWGVARVHKISPSTSSISALQTCLAPPWHQAVGALAGVLHHRGLTELLSHRVRRGRRPLPTGELLHHAQSCQSDLARKRHLQTPLPNTALFATLTTHLLHWRHLRFRQDRVWLSSIRTMTGLAKDTTPQDKGISYVHQKCSISIVTSRGRIGSSFLSS